MLEVLPISVSGFRFLFPVVWLDFLSAFIPIFRNIMKTCSAKNFFRRNFLPIFLPAPVDDRIVPFSIIFF